MPPDIRDSPTSFDTPAIFALRFFHPGAIHSTANLKIIYI